MGATTNYTLSNDILLPNQTIALSRSGSLNLGVTKPEGVGGVAGRINIPNSAFYLPFYFDAGGGSVPFTWQVYAEIAWQAASYVDSRSATATSRSRTAAGPKAFKTSTSAVLCSPATSTSEPGFS